jgi:hypothetical protein
MRNIIFRVATSLALCVGLALGAAPGYSQDADDLQVTAGKKKHRKRQERPIQLGTSGSNVEDISGGFCCGGTLGALVEKFGTQYILSNNHVLARSNSGKQGEAIIQPGYGDQSCPASDEAFDTVAQLTAKKRIRFGFDKRNKVDAAIAEVVPGAVRSDGEILRIGVPGTTPTAAFVGMEVKKSGRTTGLTRGIVVAVHATGIVPEFPLDCAGEETRTARFVDQIFIASANDKAFQGPGDSGSMVYQDVDSCPAPVGLLFAGTDEIGVASPAATVLKKVKRLKPRGDARFVGCESSQFEVATFRTPLLREQRVREAAGVMRDWEADLLGTPGVQGVGIGMALAGPTEPAIYVFTTESREEVLDRLPENLGEFRIEIIETDRFEAYCGP